MSERTQRLSRHSFLLSRRSFLLTAGGAGAATAAAIAAKRSASSGITEKSKPGSRGYQATAHVNHYYRTAKV